MWSTEQSVIITEHLNYYEQMTLVIKQIKESGPHTPKPSLPKPPVKIGFIIHTSKKEKKKHLTPRNSMIIFVPNM